MGAIGKLDAHVATRLQTFMKHKQEGVKIIGCAASGYIPEELIYAAGAIPMTLGDGGAPEPVTESLSMVPRFICTYCKCQIGYWKLKTSAYYRIPDALVVAITDANAKAIADSFAYWAKWPVYRVGIPHEKTPMATTYFRGILVKFRKWLEDFTGNEINDDAIRKCITKLNKRRELLRAISELRVGADSVISGIDYAKVHHAAYIADIDEYNAIMEELLAELKAKRADSITKRPRIMLIASTMARGDSRAYDLLGENDADIVCEEVSEGFIPYDFTVSLSGDVMDALVEGYFNGRLQGPWARPYNDRYDRLLAIAKKYEVDGVLWYQTMYRDGADMQAWSFGHNFKEDGYHFIKIETDYNAAEIEQMRTRIETFCELMAEGSEADYME